MAKKKEEDGVSLIIGELEKVSGEKLTEDFNASEYVEETEEPATSEAITPTPEEQKPTPEVVPGTKDPDAPFGRDANGKPIAPYGISRKGKVKLISGRPRPDVSPNETQTSGAAIVSDEAKLKELITPKQDPAKQAAPPVNQPTPTPEAPKSKEELLKKYTVYISGAMLLVALDFIAGNVIIRIYELFNNDTVEKKDLKLTDEEKKDMVDLADAVAKEILTGLSPMQQFALYLSMLYWTKLTYATKIPKPEKKKKK